MSTQNLQFTKKDDIAAEFYHEWGIETDALQGKWKNVNLLTGQISRFSIKILDDKLLLNCFGKVENGEMDWGLVTG